MKAIRGATTIEIDSVEQVTKRSQELFGQIISFNKINLNDIVDIIFSCTPDIKSFYPAAALRQIGCENIPMLCLSEMQVTASLPLCIRILIHIDNIITPIKHIYLHDAKQLRRDLEDV